MNEQINKMTDTQYKIIGQINLAIEMLGGSFELLCLVGSFGNSQLDDDVLEMLEQYNTNGTYMDSIIAAVNDTPEIKRSRIKLVAKKDK